MRKLLNVKKMGALFLCAWFMLASCLTVYADIIWTPKDDFFADHYEQCTYVARNFIANGAGGSANVFESPESGKIVGTFPNGEIFYVSYTYRDAKGKDWGVVTYVLDENGNLESGRPATDSGWIRMEDFTVQYDAISFDEAHESEYKAYNGEFDGYMAAGGGVVLWQYPNSGVIEASIDQLEEGPVISHTYKDADNRLWGKMEYYYGYEGWICISEPNLMDLSSKAAVNTGAIPDPLAGASQRALLPPVLIICVLFAVALTGVFIHLFWNKKKKESE